MICINEWLCSTEFLIAFKAIKTGASVRRESWPEGQILKHRMDKSIGVYRDGADCAPVWAGPSNAESDATDWIVL